jgi:hypothetical protein
LRLAWSILTMKGRPHRYGRQCRTAYTSLISSRSSTASAW